MRPIINAIIAFALMLSTASVSARDDKNPLDYPIKYWLFPLLMALLGGLASWYNKVKKRELSATNLFSLMGEFVVSALAGLMAFLVCDWLNMPIGITGAISGLAGHAGTKALSLGEVVLQRWIESRAGVSKIILPDPMNGDGKPK